MAKLFIKSTAATLAPGIFLVDVAAKPPGKTFAIYMAVDNDEPPVSLLSTIESLGFKRTVSSAYKHHDGKMVLDIHYNKPGTDIFEGWTNAEKETNLGKLTEIFSKVGIEIKPRVMSLAEAF